MEHQAENLRDFVNRSRRRARVLAVTSGKGGVGKTSTSVNLGIALARTGARVILLDADLGLANVEVLLGLNSLYNLQHVIQGEKTIDQVLVQGPGGIQLVPGSSGLSRLADLGPTSRRRIIEALQSLQSQADYIVVDTMAGIGQNTVAFAAAADEVLLVCTPEPSSIVDAYAMLKVIHQTRPEVVMRLVVNMAANEQQAHAVASKLGAVVQQYLSRRLAYLGYIPRDPHVSHGVMQTTPFLIGFPNAPASKAIDDLAQRLMRQRTDDDDERPGFFRRIAQNLGLASNA